MPVEALFISIWRDLRQHLDLPQEGLRPVLIELSAQRVEILRRRLPLFPSRRSHGLLFPLEYEHLVMPEQLNATSVFLRAHARLVNTLTLLGLVIFAELLLLFTRRAVV